MKLDFLILPTYCSKTINLFDNSVYDEDPPEPNTPLLNVVIPGGFKDINIEFIPNTYNVLNSTILGITETGEDPLPDGLYTFKYSVIPTYLNFVEKSIMRTNILQEKFDEAFMRLDMMQCDRAIKMQEKQQLNEIFIYIQGAISSANHCAFDQANSLYLKANKLLTRFMGKSSCCNYSGEFLTKFTY